MHKSHRSRRTAVIRAATRTPVRHILLGIAIACVAVTSPAVAQHIDLYVVYTSGNRAQKNDLLDALPEDLSVKAYNTNLLALADYSGKQKTIAKLETARIVVILDTGPMEHLQGSLTGPDVIIFNTAEDRLRSTGRTVYVLSGETDMSLLGNQLSVLDLDDQDALEDPSAFRDADVIVMRRAGHELLGQLSEIIQRFLGRRIASSTVPESDVGQRR